MANQSGLANLSRLSVEEREKVAEVAGDMIAVQVYRELQAASRRAGGGSGCQIIGNCSSSCGRALLE